MDKCIKKFSDLTPFELYAILRLRSKVFVVEQNCVYQDCDDLDQRAIHIWFSESNNLVAYLRILPNGLNFPDFVRIGRVVVDADWRGRRIGGQIMNYALRYCKEQFGRFRIKLFAQSHLTIFYKQFGFREEGEVFLEDEIPHIVMVN